DHLGAGVPDQHRAPAHGEVEPFAPGGVPQGAALAALHDDQVVLRQAELAIRNPGREHGERPGALVGCLVHRLSSPCALLGRPARRCSSKHPEGPRYSAASATSLLSSYRTWTSRGSSIATGSPMR